MKPVSEATGKMLAETFSKFDGVTRCTWMPMAMHDDMPGEGYVFHFGMEFKGKEIFDLFTLDKADVPEFECWQACRKVMEDIKYKHAGQPQ